MNPPPAVARPAAAGLVLAGLAALVVAWLLVPVLAPSPTLPTGDRAAAARTVAGAVGPQRSQRADRYRTGSRRIAIASLVVELVLLAALAWLRPAWLRRLFGWLSQRPLAGAAAVGGGLSLLLTVAGLPLGLVALSRGREYGLVTQGVGPWLGDLALSAAISAVIAAAGALAAVWLWRRLGKRFWIGASVVAIGWAVVSVWLWPVLVAPLFNRFEPVPDGELRSRVLTLADRSGVSVGEVYTVDASRRSTVLNAYVNGIGSTRRVVIYDNAIRQLSPAALDALVAHELAHVRSNDLGRGLLYAILVIPFGALVLQLATGWLVSRRGDGPGTPGMVPALAVSLVVVSLVLAVPGRSLSRSIESAADAAAIGLAGPDGMVELQLKLAERNLADPDPPAAWQFLFGTHPTTVQRVAGARATGGADR